MDSTDTDITNFFVEKGYTVEWVPEISQEEYAISLLTKNPLQKYSFNTNVRYEDDEGKDTTLKPVNILINTLYEPFETNPGKYNHIILMYHQIREYNGSKYLYFEPHNECLTISISQDQSELSHHTRGKSNIYYAT